MVVYNFGVVDQNIDLVYCCYCLVDQIVYIIFLVEICLNGVKVVVQCQYLGGCIMGNFMVDVDDIVFGLCQVQCYFLFQVGIVIGYDGDFICQVEGVQYYIYFCQLIYWCMMMLFVISIEGGK